MAAFRVIDVVSLDSPALLPYRTLRRTEEHRRSGIFVAEGGKVVQRLLDSPLTVLSLLLTPEWLASLGGHTREYPIDAFVAPRSMIREIVGYNVHQGIMAVGRVPAPGSPDQLPHHHLIVALDGLSQAENAGMIVRNAAGLGADAILVGERSVSPYQRRAVRNSMGTVFAINVVPSDHLRADLRRLRAHGTRIIAAHPGTGNSIHEVDLSGNVCLVLGNEDTGVSEEVLAECTAIAAIPMHNGTDSLNVSSAAAIFLYEVRRQRSNVVSRAPVTRHQPAAEPPDA